MDEGCEKSFLEPFSGIISTKIIKVLKQNGSVYICGDWKSSFCLYQAMKELTIIRNRITWQRERGRGAKANWKNATEDIWFGEQKSTKKCKYHK